MHRMAVRLWVALVVLLAVVGCGFGEPTTASLREEAAARLNAPDSDELVVGGHDAERTPEGDLPAIAWREYGAARSWGEVVGYFEAELVTDGWEPGGGSSGMRSTREYDAIAWHKGDRILRLSHRRGTQAEDAVGTWPTFYRVTLIGEGLPE